MLRRGFIFALVAAALVAPARALAQADEPVVLMPRVTYEKQVEFTSHGPVAIHVIVAPRPGGLWSLKPVLSNGAVVATERLTAMQRALSTQATVAGVNGDFYDEREGTPQGVMLQSGLLSHAPHSERASIGIANDGTLRVERVRPFGTWRGSGQRRPLVLNDVPGPNGVALFTPTRGPLAPAVAGGVAAIVPSLPQLTPNTEFIGTVSELRPAAPAIAIPPGGAVMIARGTGAQRVQAEAAAGTDVRFRVVLSPEWANVSDAIGGGPVLVRDGRPVFRHGEPFGVDQVGRNARAAVGQLRDGRIVLVVVDGRQHGYSVGMTSFEMARTLVRLGAVTGGGLGVGRQAAMAFEGRLLSRPLTGAEHPVSNALLVMYRGVYAAPPSEPVVSPNGDGVADSTDLSYKVVRPSRVTVTLVGPDRAPRQLDVADKAPGIYRLVWNGRMPTGEPEREGRWRFLVTAADDQGQASTAERPFSLNRTLASLTAARRGTRVVARFTLARRARVTVTVETAGGALIAFVTRGRSLGAGAQAVASRPGLAGAGRRVRVVAENEVGRAELVAPLSR